MVGLETAWDFFLKNLLNRQKTYKTVVAPRVFKNTQNKRDLQLVRNFPLIHSHYIKLRFGAWKCAVDVFTSHLSQIILL